MGTRRGADKLDLKVPILPAGDPSEIGLLPFRTCTGGPFGRHAQPRKVEPRFLHHAAVGKLPAMQAIAQQPLYRPQQGHRRFDFPFPIAPSFGGAKGGTG